MSNLHLGWQRALREAVNTPTVYEENGYRSRRHYLESLTEEIGAPLDVVLATAQLLGPEEDFDGLVTTLQDEYQ